MNISCMTVVQIARFLEQDDLSTQIIDLLRGDSRSSVVRLLDKWQRRQTNRRCEQNRIENLYSYERSYNKKGFRLIAGIDEAGRGPLAGPVVIGAAILPLGCYLPNLNDSKKLSPKQRSELYDAIKNVAIAVNHSVIGVEDIDRLNIYQATVWGMYQAIDGLCPQPNTVLIDAVPLPKLKVPSLSLIGGDGVSASIAAASIIAKVERDRIMEKLDAQFPMYGFLKHKGYGTPEHLIALHEYGPCSIHRQSFEPVKSWANLRLQEIHSR